ncbi:hypothetical protein CTAM01_07766 [Colletotrichum tamarilloi]|uniref:Uncharacterized protein n=1 Tax=Colletotrichum tamarilloi TaxID=1209934 RepID=A0ABQ9R7X0_9PEZI|nr:uncharacterized protein CTAM01_07766 [Colletotrichum tamarilloi]KAI3530233.1 hypothetical protein CSPX01_14967 [Colletotrichum filicis]KAK1497496.1 hypothetical protein CTAM01_07766 [Colletotrichum tamarilloi]
MASATESVQTQHLALLSGLHALTIPKDNHPWRQPQPPAYSPQAQPTGFGSIASHFVRRDITHDSQYSQRTSHLPQDSILDAEEEDEEEESSPISLRISTRIDVASDSSLIALPYSPASQANFIAKAIVDAIHDRDWTVGCPLIDENGRPRPLKLEVDAGITVRGSSNVIGTEAVITEFLRHGTHTQKKPPHRQHPRQSTDSAASPSSPNRRRSASELDAPEHPVYKRARSEE